VQARLLDYLVKLAFLFYRHVVLEMLELLDTVYLSLGLAVDVPLTDFFLDARVLPDILLVTLDHALLLHLELILDLLKLFNVLGRLDLQWDYRGFIKFRRDMFHDTTGARVTLAVHQRFIERCT
jgi:hypothetical protein